jgi:hypothetical protein
MTFGFYIAVGIFLVLVKTTVLPFLAGYGECYDLFIPLVLYLVVFRPTVEAAPGVILAGGLMDSLSAAPFGMHGLTYLGLFAAGYLFRGAFQVGNRLFLAAMAFAAAAVQGGMALGLMWGKSGEGPEIEVLKTVGAHLIAAPLTAPFIMSAVRLLHGQWIRWMSVITGAEVDDGGSGV